MGNDYRQDLQIDRYNLLNELIQQPQLYMEWSQKAVEATHDLEVAKDHLAVVMARVEKNIRKDPEKYGVEYKEGAIKAAIKIHKKVKKANKKYLAALKEKRIYERVEQAFRQRKRALSDMVQLNIQLNYAEPKVPTDTRHQIDRSTRKQLSKKLKRRKRR